MRRFLAASLLLLAPLSACSCGSSSTPPCTKDADCKMGQKCVPTLLKGDASTVDGALKLGPNVCFTGAECASEADCTAMDPRKTCDPGTHKCNFRPGFGNECSETMPCPFGQFCSMLAGKCYDASMSRDCVRRSQCPSGQTCDLMVNKCIPDMGCFGDQFCESGEKCDLVDHVCISSALECQSCFTTGQCMGSATCTSDTKECIAGTENRACSTGEKCDPLGRCVQCTASDQCGPGTFCNVSVGRCESNVQCALDPSECPMSAEVHCIMCTAPETCDPITKTCQGMSKVCGSDIDCPGDKFCNLMATPPTCVKRIPDCVEDNYDPNSTAATAATLAEGMSPTTYGALVMCPGHDDWFKISTHGPTFLTIDVRFHHADGDIEAELYLADGTTLIAASRKQTDNQRVEVDAGSDATFLLHVFLATPTINPVHYSLIVTRDPGDACMGDGNPSPSTARPIQSDMPFEGRICTATPDWFVVRQVPASTRIEAVLTFANSLGNLDLEMYRPGQTTPLITSATNNDVEQIDYDASYGGDYYFRVLGRGADQNVFTFRVNLRANPSAACMDDRFEPNNIPTMATDATPLVGTVTSTLTICSSDQDWYSLNLAAGEAITAEIGYQWPADLELALYPGGTTDPRIDPLRVSSGTSDRQFVGWRTLDVQSVLVRVYGHTMQDMSPYDLRINKLPNSPCTPDVLDRMNKGTTMGNAFLLPMPPTRFDNLTLCGGSEDWFQVILIAGFTNVLRIHFVEADGRLDFSVLNMNGMALATTGGQGTDWKEIQANVPGSGLATLFVRVFKSSGGDVSYSITQDLIPLFTCLPDAAEPNGDPQHASLVASSTVTPIDLSGLTLCTTMRDRMNRGEEDWFLIHPPHAGVRINASISYVQGDLFLELFSPGGHVRACQNQGMDRCFSDSDGLFDSISFTATTSAPYYLRVGSIYSSPTFTVLPINTDTPYTLHLDYQAP